MREADLVLKRNFSWLLALGILLNIPGLFLDIMEPDGALYATIAKHIVLHRDWINLFGDGHDWLDKPHFPFWMAAASYKVLGINGFAYKLPAFLFWLGGLWYTYVTARDLFNDSVARISVLLYTVALHSTLANFDVRAEPYLTTCIIASVWHMLAAYRNGNFWHVVAAAFFAACAMMTKGIFVLATIGGGWVIFWIITRQWKQFVNYKWWIMAVLCLVFIIPELYSLYVQFDMHPEKVVFGRTNVSGVRFFFWDSQFGRFFNTGPIKGSGNKLFFLHTTLWAFLPWSAGLVAGIVYLIGYDKNRDPARWIIYGSALVTFVLFSLSKFQLPHYIVIIFPYLSVITAFFIDQQAENPGLKHLVKVQTALVLLLGATILWLLYITGIKHAITAATITLLLVLAGSVVKFKSRLLSLLFKGYVAAAMMYVFLFVFFYPFLLEYQSGRKAAGLIPVRDRDVPVAAYGAFSYTFEFYAPGDVALLGSKAGLQHFLDKKPGYLFTSAAFGDSLIRSGVKADILGKPAYYRITKLKLHFLDSRKRDEMLETRYLLYIR
ncbi:glycosyl transferase [Dyadobacter flavalbus]|uniref:Glycosyl transferase n=1 Tax=Dyadobacter flavalbus TaxID=2579942 RepID=A0A5M8QGZ2_9BACT|nr:glycosyltransferase family 39 protein [Dyadobacter flavalbus]KAA6434103.1 glycosyl transferase [Dyadobacter flavalbus]